jgi:ATP-dependent DNA helicase RecG
MQNYEDTRSLNQELTFNTAKELFKKKDMPFGIKQEKTLCLKTADGAFTNLGFLLSDQSTHAVKLAIFEGLEKENFKDRKEFSGSLFMQLEEIYEYLDRYNRLYRTDRHDYPEEALREALLNMIIHRDYSFSGSAFINIYDDRIEFISIGGLPKGITLDDIKLGISVLRNEKLANVFYRLNLIEAYGTGIPKITRSYEDCSKKPILQVSNNVFKIILPNRNITIQAENKPAYYTANEKNIIKLLEERGDIDRKDVETALGVSQAQAVRYLRSLVEKGALHVTGGGKKTRYGRGT